MMVPLQVAQAAMRSQTTKLTNHKRRCARTGSRRRVKRAKLREDQYLEKVVKEFAEQGKSKGKDNAIERLLDEIGTQTPARFSSRCFEPTSKRATQVICRTNGHHAASGAQGTMMTPETLRPVYVNVHPFTDSTHGGPDRVERRVGPQFRTPLSGFSSRHRSLSPDEL